MSIIIAIVALIFLAFGCTPDENQSQEGIATAVSATVKASAEEFKMPSSGEPISIDVVTENMICVSLDLAPLWEPGGTGELLAPQFMETLEVSINGEVATSDKLQFLSTLGGYLVFDTDGNVVGSYPSPYVICVLELDTQQSPILFTATAEKLSGELVEYEIEIPLPD